MSDAQFIEWMNPGQFELANVNVKTELSAKEAAKAKITALLEKGYQFAPIGGGTQRGVYAVLMYLP